MLKISRIFPKKISLKNVGPGGQLLIKNVFENFDFLNIYFLKMCPIFGVSVHNFGRFYGDNI